MVALMYLMALSVGLRLLTRKGVNLVAMGNLLITVSVGFPTWAQSVGSEDGALYDVLGQAAKAFQGEGIVVSANTVDVSNAVTSIVREIHFEAEQFVEAGDKLFSLDAVEFELAEAAAQAEVARARARLDLSVTSLERVERLATSGTISEVALEEARAGHDIAEAELALAEVKLRRARVDLGYTTILAPISGTVGPSLVSVGAYVEAEEGEPLARIVQLDPILVSYEEPYKEQLEMLWPLLDGNFDELLDVLTVRIQLTDNLVYPIASKPIRISSTVDPNSGQITLWSAFRNPGYILRPGMRVTVVSEIDKTVHQDPR